VAVAGHKKLFIVGIVFTVLAAVIVAYSVYLSPDSIPRDLDSIVARLRTGTASAVSRKDDVEELCRIALADETGVEDRSRAIEVLQKDSVPFEQACASLCAQAVSPNEKKASLALAILSDWPAGAEFQSSPDVERVALSGLNRSQKQIRRGAAMTLARLSSLAAVKKMVLLAADSDLLVRQVVRQRLVELGAPISGADHELDSGKIQKWLNNYHADSAAPGVVKSAEGSEQDKVHNLRRE
jgi:hypothetical protein